MGRKRRHFLEWRASTTSSKRSSRAATWGTSSSTPHSVRTRALLITAWPQLRCAVLQNLQQHQHSHSKLHDVRALVRASAPRVRPPPWRHLMTGLPSHPRRPKIAEEWVAQVVLEPGVVAAVAAAVFHPSSLLHLSRLVWWAMVRRISPHLQLAQTWCPGSGARGVATIAM